MRRKIYALICAGFIMAMAAIQVQAGEIKNIDGLCFSGENAINVRKIDESTYFAYYKKED